MAIIAQDKNYLNKQVEQLNQARLLNECKIEDLTQQLAETRHSKELLFDKFVSVRLVVIILLIIIIYLHRETQRIGYESRIQQEMEQFHSRTNLGIEQLRLHTREMFERENRLMEDVLAMVHVLL